MHFFTMAPCLFERRAESLAAQVTDAGLDPDEDLSIDESRLSLSGTYSWPYPDRPAVRALNEMAQDKC